MSVGREVASVPEAVCTATGLAKKCRLRQQTEWLCEGCSTLEAAAAKYG